MSMAGKNLLLLVIGAILYEYFVIMWMKHLEHLNDNNRQKQLTYKTIQVFNNVAMEALKNYIAFLILIGVILTIALFFNAIRLPISILYMKLICLFLGIFVTFVENFSTKQAIYYHQSSVKLITACRKQDPKNSYNYKVWAGVQPIKARVGSFGYIESSDFFRIICDDIILQVLLNLLLLTAM